MRLILYAFFVTLGLFPAFVLGLWLGLRSLPHPVDCAPYPVSTPAPTPEAREV